MIPLLAGAAYDPTEVDASGPIRWLLVSAVAGLCLLLWRRDVGRGGVWMTLLLCYVALSATWSPSPGALLVVAQSATLLAVFLVGASGVGARWDSLGLGLACVIQALFLVAQLDGANPTVADPPGTLAGLHLYRGTAAEFGVGALVYLVTARRWIWVPAALVCAALPGSLGAALGALAALAAWLAPRVGRDVRAAVALGALFYLVAPLLAWWTLPHLEVRREIWWATISGLTWFGRGAGSFAHYFPNAEHAHDDYLQLLFEYGVGALLALPVLWGLLRSREQDRDADAARLGALAILATAFVGFPLGTPGPAILLALLAGRALHGADAVLSLVDDGSAGGASGVSLQGPEAGPRAGGPLVPVRS